MCGASSCYGITNLLPVVMRFSGGVQHWWTVSEIEICRLISSRRVFLLPEGHNVIVSDKHKWHMMCNQLSIKHKRSIFKQQTHLFAGNNLERRILTNRGKLYLAMGKSAQCDKKTSLMAGHLAGFLHLLEEKLANRKGYTNKQAC